MNIALTPLAVLTAIGALLAFLIGLFTLVGRERKSPYLINSVFPIFLTCTLGAAFTVMAALLSTWREQLLYVATTLLLLAILQTLWRIYKIYIRFAYLVDSVSLKNLVFYRKMKDLYRQIRGKAVYEHNPEPISSDLLDQIAKILKEEARSVGGNWESRPSIEKRSLTMALSHQGQANEILARLTLAFLREGHGVQYLTASRHPIEFIELLKNCVEQEAGISWQEVAQRIVVVDAFTPHFGSTDSILRVKTRIMKSDLNVACIVSPVSYAGMHSASAKAFNLTKKRAGREVRKPVLVLYEDTYALSDLESSEQYRIFVRHVLPSERLWDGMFTVFTDVAQENADWAVLSSYASFSADLRNRVESTEPSEDS